MDIKKLFKFNLLSLNLFTFNLYLGLLFLGANQATYANETKPLLFVADHFPPYEYASPTGKALGMDSEAISVAFQRLGLKATFEFVPWKRVMEMAKAGEATGYFSCAYKQDREAFSLYSDPINQTTQGLIYKKTRNLGNISTLSVLKDRRDIRVFSILGYAQNKHLDDLGIKYGLAKHVSLAFTMLHNGRYDMLYLSLESGRFLALEAGYSDAFVFQAATDRAPRDYHLCFSKKWPGHEELRDKFNSEFAAMKADGTLDQIHDRYR
ncbi:MAG: transporter substrate-binding domain-containing protein [Alphaproteobacteria bacterium]|nr:transporter substrate-binding domain-containing protein [Alphaproteobacteria bacterium]